MNSRIQFKIPAQIENEDIEKYADRAAGEIIGQIERLLNSEKSTTPEFEKTIAEDLVQFTTTLDSDLAFSILFDATQLKIGQEAKDIIQKAFESESAVRFPFMSNPTLECLEQQAEKNSNIVEVFLTNPQWLLSWFEKASTEEISRTIEQYFRPDTFYSKQMLALKNKEIASDEPGYATVCYALINRDALQLSAYTELLPALSYPKIYSANIPRTVASAQLRISLINQFMQDETEQNEWNIQSLQNAGAKKYFVHLPSLPLFQASFQQLDFSGALLNKCVFKDVQFNLCALSYCQFTECELNNTDFSASSLCATNFTSGKLTSVNFHLTDLSQCKFNFATITKCDFSNANLKGADFTKATLKGNIFICRDKLDTPQHIEDEFNRLASIIETHHFKAGLRAAILQDLLAYCLENRATKDVINLFLWPAYHHELFAGHRKFRVAKDAVNIASSKVSGFIWSLMPNALYQQPDEKEAPQASNLMETGSQESIRLFIEKLQALKATKRPNPPDRLPLRLSK